MKILSIVGARPEFIQATPVSRALREHYTEVLVHTGQHYDYQMSGTFFDELGTPKPDYNLEVGSGSHGQQTAQMLVRLEEVMEREKPALVITRGDTNSTLAGALVASKLNIPMAHIEAGERSYDRRMPEEVNRVVTDSLADLHFCASVTASRRLAAEGIDHTVYFVGDVMLDALKQNMPVAQRNSRILGRLGLEAGHYALVTVHRAGNTDDPARLAQIVAALNQVDEPIVFPVHPRTRAALRQSGAALKENVQVIDPVGYFDMMLLEQNARLIATDSGGVQREAYFMAVPCITLRDETEWVETVATGWNMLVGADSESILDAWSSFQPPAEHPPIFGDGTASQQIVEILRKELPRLLDRRKSNPVVRARVPAADRNQFA